MNEIKPGYKTTEFYGTVALYVLAAYVIYQGYSPEQINDVYESIEDNVTTYKDMFSQLSALIIPLVGNMFYTKKRTELKEVVPK